MRTECALCLCEGVAKVTRRDKTAFVVEDILASIAIVHILTININRQRTTFHKFELQLDFGIEAVSIWLTLNWDLLKMMWNLLEL